jgi:PII-like signaling protein
VQLFNKKRISIIVEGAYRDAVLELVENSGASGFTVYTGIYGKGRHGIKENRGGFGGFSCNVEIVTITSPGVADRILQGLQQMMEEGIMLVVHVADVQVVRDHHFS